MSLPSKTSKENFRLLDLTSDEQSDDLQLEIIPTRKKKISRRERSKGPTSRVVSPGTESEVQCALRWAVRGTLLLWLLMLTSICATLYEQVSSMGLDIARVSTSSDSVGDALQVCHTAAKELRANASDLNARLSRLEAEHTELVQRVERTASEVAAVADQLAAAPKLADTPRRLAELQRTVADFGSQINGLDSTLQTTRKQASSAANGVEEIRTLVHELESRANDTVANVTVGVKRDDELGQLVATLNTTLAARIDTLQKSIQELQKSPSALSTVSNATSSSVPGAPPVSAKSAPVPASSPATSPAAPPAPPTVPAPPPNPPVKPNVLH